MDLEVWHKGVHAVEYWSIQHFVSENLAWRLSRFLFWPVLWNKHDNAYLCDCVQIEDIELFLLHISYIYCFYGTGNIAVIFIWDYIVKNLCHYICEHMEILSHIILWWGFPRTTVLNLSTVTNVDIWNYICVFDEVMLWTNCLVQLIDLGKWQYNHLCMLHRARGVSTRGI